MIQFMVQVVQICFINLTIVTSRAFYFNRLYWIILNLANLVVTAPVARYSLALDLHKVTRSRDLKLTKVEVAWSDEQQGFVVKAVFKNAECDCDAEDILHTLGFRSK